MLRLGERLWLRLRASQHFLEWKGGLQTDIVQGVRAGMFQSCILGCNASVSVIVMMEGGSRPLDSDYNKVCFSFAEHIQLLMVFASVASKARVSAGHLSLSALRYASTTTPMPTRNCT